MSLKHWCSQSVVPSLYIPLFYNREHIVQHLIQRK